MLRTLATTGGGACATKRLPAPPQGQTPRFVHQKVHKKYNLARTLPLSCTGLLLGFLVYVTAFPLSRDVLEWTFSKRRTAGPRAAHLSGPLSQCREEVGSGPCPQRKSFRRRLCARFLKCRVSVFGSNGWGLCCVGVGLYFCFVGVRLGFCVEVGSWVRCVLMFGSLFCVLILYVGVKVVIVL